MSQVQLNNSPDTTQLIADDGMPLHINDWPCTSPRAMRRGVMILHGIGEHSGRYAHVARFFNERGFDVRGLDHRGHGRSGGTRGDTPDDLAILRDATLAMNDFAQRLDTPPLLLGHSMGGAFAAHFAAARAAPISGLILSSPALALRLSAWHKLLLWALSSLAPGFGVTNRVPDSYLSHDQSVIDAYRNDPLVHVKITARLLLSIMASIEYAQQHASAIVPPTLLLVAGDDHVVDARGSDAFHARLPAGAGTILHYPDLYHEIFNGSEATRVFADLDGWLSKQSLLPERPATQTLEQVPHSA